MENKNNAVLYYGIGAVVIVVIIIFLAANRNKISTTAINENNTNQVISTEDTSSGSVNAVKPIAVISYADALKKYKDARIQLDKTCQATPNNVTYKNDISLMIDNRAETSRTIKLGSVYTVKAYGFKIIKLSSDILPRQFLLDCDKSQNVATVLIQK